MDWIASIIIDIDDLLDTGRKRHLIGGIFISLALLCSGLAITIGTMKEEPHE